MGCLTRLIYNVISKSFATLKLQRTCALPYIPYLKQPSHRDRECCVHQPIFVLSPRVYSLSDAVVLAESNLLSTGHVELHGLRQPVGGIDHEGGTLLTHY